MATFGDLLLLADAGVLVVGLRRAGVDGGSRFFLLSSFLRLGIGEVSEKSVSSSSVLGIFFSKSSNEEQQPTGWKFHSRLPKNRTKVISTQIQPGGLLCTVANNFP